MGLTQYLKTVRDRQWFQIIRVQLAGVGASISPRHVHYHQVRPHQAHLQGHGYRGVNCSLLISFLHFFNMIINSSNI